MKYSGVYTLNFDTGSYFDAKINCDDILFNNDACTLDEITGAECSTVACTKGNILQFRLPSECNFATSIEIEFYFC